MLVNNIVANCFLQLGDHCFYTRAGWSLQRSAFLVLLCKQYSIPRTHRGDQDQGQDQRPSALWGAILEHMYIGHVADQGDVICMCGC